MRPPELAHVNLNQLVALDALLELRNVRLAAERLGVTQSAMSHTLRQLRATFDDLLLVRAGNRMLPTPRGEALHQPLREALLRVQAVVQAQGERDPATSTRRVTIAASDAATVVVVPRLLAVLQQQAPGIEVDVVPVDRPALAQQLEAGTVDLAITPTPGEAAGIEGRRLYPSSFAVLACRDHPELGERLDLDTYCRLPHVLVALADRGPGLVDRELERRGRARRVVVRVPYFLAAPPMVAGSRRLLTAPRDAAEHFVRHHSLRLFDPPLPLPRGQVWLTWHERFSRDAVHRWLRERLVEVTVALRSTGGRGK
jgi:DNA-binding transcriptional LysR family regulator